MLRPKRSAPEYGVLEAGGTDCALGMGDNPGSTANSRRLACPAA